MEIKDIKQVYLDFVTTKSELDVLGKRLNSLKQQIIEYHNGEDVMQIDGFQSKVSHCMKQTLLEEAIQKKYNICFDDNDYKHTMYDRLSVTRI